MSKPFRVVPPTTKYGASAGNGIDGNLAMFLSEILDAVGDNVDNSEELVELKGKVDLFDKFLFENIGDTEKKEQLKEGILNGEFSIVQQMAYMEGHFQNHQDLLFDRTGKQADDLESLDSKVQTNTKELELLNAILINDMPEEQKQAALDGNFSVSLVFNSMYDDFHRFENKLTDSESTLNNVWDIADDAVARADTANGKVDELTAKIQELEERLAALENTDDDGENSNPPPAQT